MDNVSERLGKKVLLDPAFPNIYLPDGDFQKFSENLNSRFNSKLNNDNEICDYTKGYCMI